MVMVTVIVMVMVMATVIVMVIGPLPSASSHCRGDAGLWSKGGTAHTAPSVTSSGSSV
jgi:hypothetical protein